MSGYPTITRPGWYPTIERLADPAQTTVGYQGPILVAEAVACFREVQRLREYAEGLERSWADSLQKYSDLLRKFGKLHSALTDPSKNPNPSGQLTTEASGELTRPSLKGDVFSAEASGPVGLGPERYCKYCELPIEDIGDEEGCPLKPEELTQTSSPICTCGSDVVPGPFHHPTCPSREPHEGNEERTKPKPLAWFNATRELVTFGDHEREVWLQDGDTVMPLYPGDPLPEEPHAERGES